MKRFLSLSLILLLIIGAVFSLPAKEAKKKIIDKTAYLYEKTYLPGFYDYYENYTYSYSVENGESIKVSNDYKYISGAVRLIVVGKKLTSGKKPVITVYRKKAGGKKQV